MSEQWKEIESCKGYYVSNLGQIKSPFKILKQQLDNDGYKVIKLNYGGKKRNVKVHRLVAKAFIPNPLNKSDVNHKDYNPSNNCVNNLEWTTRSENNLWSSERISKSA